MDELLNKIKLLENHIEHLEFKQNLLFSNTDVDRIVYEYNLTKDQYQSILDLMDNYREAIENNEEVSHNSFESKVYGIVPQYEYNYHFVESLAMGFWEEGRWEEVFENLYMTLPKYSYLKKE